MAGFYKEKYEYPVKVFEKLLKGKDILDIGCGDGRLSFLLSNYSKSVTGVDNQMLPLKYARYLTGNRIPVVCCSGEKLSFKDESFEAVTLFDVLEHLPVGLHSILFNEINRVIKDEGILVISTPNRKNLRRRIFGFTINPKHYYEYTKNELINMIQTNNFEVIDIRGAYLPVLPFNEFLYKMPVLKYLVIMMIKIGAYFPDLSETLLISSKKSDKNKG